MAARPIVTPLVLVLPSDVANALNDHLFPGDDDEHGGVLLAGRSVLGGRTRLLGREFVPAKDGLDYVEGVRGYRQLRAAFVRDQILRARDEELVYLAVHNHGGRGPVAFSSDDVASHARGYPALLDISRGGSVGALVFVRDSVAGVLWQPDGRRRELTEAMVVGHSMRRLVVGASQTPSEHDERYDRQTRIFGQRGQTILANLRVGIIGAGGVGMLLVEYLSRLGVGELVVVDPDRVAPSNLPRLAGARKRDAHGPSWMRGPLAALGRRLATPKVEVARRLAREANPDGRYIGLRADATEPEVAERLAACDYLFCAADSMRARLLFNALVAQYLIPGVQIGSKVRSERATGTLTDVRSVVRPVTPEVGCLWCNGLISPALLAEEALTESERQAQRYVDDPEVTAPSVITLNAVGAALAANDFLFAATGLTSVDADASYLRVDPLTRTIRREEPRRDSTCPECGSVADSRRARGDGRPLPVRARHTKRYRSRSAGVGTT